MLYKQCRLKQGDSFTTSWIPKKFALEGKLLSIKDKETSEWSDWIVESVGGEQEDPKDVRELIKGHRKMTGDSLPKRSLKNEK